MGKTGEKSRGNKRKNEQSSEPDDKRSKQDEVERASEKTFDAESPSHIAGQVLTSTTPVTPPRQVNNDDDERTNGKSGDASHVLGETLMPTTPVTPHRGENRAKPPGRGITKTINIAVSSRALFNLDEENEIFMRKGLKEYIKKQVSKENNILSPGSAFPFIKALNNVNAALRERNPEEEELFTVTLMSKNNAQVGIRLQKSIESYQGLKIKRMALTSGTSPVEYLAAFNITLFLTSEEEDVKEALKRGFPSAVMSTQVTNPPSETQLRVAFDFDAVLISDESEKIYREDGLEKFRENEKENRDKPLEDGPIKPFAMALGKMTKKFESSEDGPIRTFLVTSRDAEVCERALKTLRDWGLEIDESFFMAGAPKDEVLRAINPHIFFDDQKSHIDSARKSGTPSAHVPTTGDRTYTKSDQESVTTNLFEAKE